jgi:osmotically inducible protein OsmC
MALANELAEAGFDPVSVRTTARVHLEMLDDGPAITRIELDCQARVDGIDQERFREFAEGAKAGCPVSKALSATEIGLSARLLG